MDLNRRVAMEVEAEKPGRYGKPTLLAGVGLGPGLGALLALPAVFLDEILRMLIWSWLRGGMPSSIFCPQIYRDLLIALLLGLMLSLAALAFGIAAIDRFKRSDGNVQGETVGAIGVILSLPGIMVTVFGHLLGLGMVGLTDWCVTYLG
jgi:hypothetical protein